MYAGLGQFYDLPSWGFAGGSAAVAMRVGDWKILVSGEKEKQKVELFDLAKDPSESENLAEQQPDRVKQLLEEMNKMAARDRDAVVEK